MAPVIAEGRSFLGSGHRLVIGRDRPTSSQDGERRENLYSDQSSTITLPRHDTPASDSAAASPDDREIQQ
ncbi:MAG: hypothetical protein ACYDAG_08530 [Chloroflexota bacterium]